MKNNSVNNMDFPKVNSGDVRESAEMLRATMTMLRQCYSIVWMRKTLWSDVSDEDIKSFTEHFDAVQRFFYDSHNVFMNQYGSLVESEKIKKDGLS